MVAIEMKCCFCGKLIHIDMTEEQYNRYKAGDDMIKVMLNAHKMVREALISSICFDCQSSMFNTPKPDEDWGEELEPCEICGIKLWKRDVKDGKIECKFCGEERVVI